MTCIIVGNGTSLLDAKRGAWIDSFDVVVRFNRFRINGFEKYVGMKTTDWYNTQYIEPNSFRFENIYRRFIFHTWHWGEECDRYKTCWPFVRAMEKSTTERKTIEEMKKFLGEEYVYFSTGAIAVWELLREFSSVSLVGFDWWDRKEHHYGDGEKRGSLHKPEIERRFFKKLGPSVKLEP
ncbi:MAG: hypothetical protein FMNOHCHN_03636 [Ignavibacteriaceae bacterium]|nr:hypothetical protein [Ignavibacteriaceae bacterium]